MLQKKSSGISPPGSLLSCPVHSCPVLSSPFSFPPLLHVPFLPLFLRAQQMMEASDLQSVHNAVRYIDKKTRRRKQRENGGFGYGGGERGGRGHGKTTFNIEDDLPLA